MVQKKAQGETRVVVLAAGQGTRMRSERAKVLHEVCGLSMLGHAQRVAHEVDARRPVVVVGAQAEAVREACQEGEVEFVVQAEQRGTGHAVKMAQEALSGFEGDVLILYGDTPLLRASTVLHMQSVKRETHADLVVLTAAGSMPGRIVRGASGQIERIVEAQDASPDELAISERNTGVYLIDATLLWPALASLQGDNNQSELYLTDVVAYAVQGGHRVEGVLIEDAEEGLGINTRSELAEANRIMRRRISERLMESGVTLVDPETTYIDINVEVGPDTVIEPGCSLLGQTRIGARVHIKAGSYIEDSVLDDDVIFGPYSHLRPDSHLQEGVRIGNFVEIKNAVMGPGSKSAHLTYIGDADIGADVNFGCGSVVVNYDGYEKHRSTVGDGVFVGCNVNLVSPVKIEPRAFLAAGSTITKPVPEDALAVARANQRTIEGWVARKEGRPRAERGDAEPSDSGSSSEDSGTRNKAAEKKSGT